MPIFEINNFSLREIKLREIANDQMFLHFLRKLGQIQLRYKIDLSEGDPTAVNIQLDIEHPKPQFSILNRRFIFGR